MLLAETQLVIPFYKTYKLFWNKNMKKSQVANAVENTLAGDTEAQANTIGQSAGVLSHIHNQWVSGSTQTTRISDIKSLIGLDGDVRGFDDNGGMVFWDTGPDANAIFDELNASINPFNKSHLNGDCISLDCGFISVASISGIRKHSKNDEDMILILSRSGRCLISFSTYDYRDLDGLLSILNKCLIDPKSRLRKTIDWDKYLIAE